MQGKEEQQREREREGERERGREGERERGREGERERDHIQNIINKTLLYVSVYYKWHVPEFESFQMESDSKHGIEMRF